MFQLFSNRLFAVLLLVYSVTYCESINKSFEDKIVQCDSLIQDYQRLYELYTVNPSTINTIKLYNIIRKLENKNQDFDCTIYLNKRIDFNELSVIKNEIMISKLKSGFLKLSALGIFSYLIYSKRSSIMNFLDKKSDIFISSFMKYVLPATITSLILSNGATYISDQFLDFSYKINKEQRNIIPTKKFYSTVGRMYFPGDINVNFDSVIGATQAKNDLYEIVDFLKNPEKYIAAGAKLPKGVLLIGEPGNGKTLLARAMAGEANCNFLTINGSEFNGFIGEGSAKVRELFNIARQNSPCIIFIDEIDAFAIKRNLNSDSGSIEFAATVNQFLAEMDGFEQYADRIVIIGATNRVAAMDPAFLRAGRFDRQVSVTYPNQDERIKILELYSENIQIDTSVNLEKIAKEAIGFSASELANLINEAALNAVRNNRTITCMDDLLSAEKKIRNIKTLKLDSKARIYKASEIEEKFKSVAGLAEAKEELQDVLDYLKNPEKFKSIGAKLPKGVLLVGEPGNGKTLLARALAGEANCNFLSISGSDFQEKWVGTGSEAVKNLFNDAKINCPCIIFIDEIDSIGRKRSESSEAGEREYERVLNQLLTEMDGFNKSEAPVIVIGATNRIEMLDPALLRAGRFDRHVYVPNPNAQERLQVLLIHSKNAKLDSKVNLNKIAQGTIGFSGADLANLINEAVIIAIRASRKVVNMQDLEEAKDKIVLGKATKSIKMNDYEKKVTAYHEAGHTLVRLLLPEDDYELYNVTIVPREKALGLTCSLPTEERYSSSKNELLAHIQVALGGRIAEEIIYKKLFTGASNDFEKATKIARDMVCKYGMSTVIGTMTYSSKDANNPKINNEIQKIIKECYDKTYKLLSDNKDKLDKLANALFVKETMYADEIKDLLGLSKTTKKNTLNVRKAVGAIKKITPKVSQKKQIKKK